MHATWNLLVARARDPQAATAVGGVLGGLAFAPVAIATWDVSAEAIPYAAASAAIHVAYFALLAFAYSRADLSAIYPLARGSAPVLVLVGAVLVLDESPSWLQAVGVLAVGAGVIGVRGLRGGEGRAELLGLVVGVTIAAYTVVDKQGVEHAAALPYLLLLNLPASTIYLALVVRARGRDTVLAELRPLAFVTGLGMLGAYALTLAALELAQASAVAATREASVLFATAFGAVLLHERVGPMRALGAAAIVAGVAAVAVG